MIDFRQNAPVVVSVSRLTTTCTAVLYACNHFCGSGDDVPILNPAPKALIGRLFLEIGKPQSMRQTYLNDGGGETEMWAVIQGFVTGYL